jgi:16S rRNA (uracil1498-N3)-methyltransferase
MELPEAAANHATRVLRLGEGDALRVFDGGFEFEATIAAIDKRRVVLEVGEAVASLPERGVPLHLIMSPLKGDLTELVIQKATELGVDRIYPAIFERTDTVARRDPNQTRQSRWRRVAVGAAEQSGRAKVPRIDPVATLKEVVSALEDGREGEVRVVAMEPSLDRRSERLRDPAGVRSVLVAVGPAGGLTDGDLEILSAASFLPERFALHTLRSETACLAALAILGDRFQ